MKINPAEFAKRAYKGRLDKKGEPYIGHLVRVASHFNQETDYNRYAAA